MTNYRAQSHGFFEVSYCVQYLSEKLQACLEAWLDQLMLLSEYPSIYPFYNILANYPLQSIQYIFSLACNITIHMSKEIPRIKLALVGDSCVRKNWLIYNYAYGQVPEACRNRSEDNSFQKYIDEKLVILIHEDTTVQEFQIQRQTSYTQCDIYFIVFSVINPKTYENAITKWYDSVKKFNKYQPPFIIFVGNDIELRGCCWNNQGKKQTEISKEAAKAKIQGQFLCTYWECSEENKKSLYPRLDQAMRTVLKKRNHPIITQLEDQFLCNLI